MNAAPSVDIGSWPMVREARLPRGALPTFVRAAVVLLLLSVAFEGAVRWGLASVGAVWLVYVPKFLASAAVGLVVATAVVTGRVTVTGLVAAALLLASLASGLVFIGEPRQVLFGGFVLLPAMLGLASQGALGPDLSRYRVLVHLIFWTGAAGVFLDRALELPWEGFSFDIGDVEVSASRDWTSGGVERAGGFTRGSPAAAALLMVTGVCAACWTRSRGLRVLAWLVCGVAVAATTTKTMLVAWLVATPVVFVPRRLEGGGWTLMVVGLGTVGLALPLASILVVDPYGTSAEQFGPVHTLWVRMAATWPGMHTFLLDHGAPLIGRGLGGVDSPVLVFEPRLYLPSDNLQVFLYATFGVLGPLVMVFFVLRAARLRPSSGPTQQAIAGVVVVLLVFGMTANVLQSAYLGFLFGLAWGHLPWRRGG